VASAEPDRVHAGGAVRSRHRGPTVVSRTRPAIGSLGEFVT
jgi:hypothetical protein